MFVAFSVALLALLFPVAGSATIWQVGPTRTHTKPSGVMPLVQNGDTVLIDQGVYLGDVGVWSKNDLLIRGQGTVILDAAGKNAQGKGIWVITGSNTTVEYIQFTGATVADHNGAGIRQEGPGLTLRHCIFYHNEDGVLTSADPSSDILFEACEFSHNGYGDGQSHNMYVGRVHSFTMRFCYSHDARQGHIVKSRAWHNYIYCNRLTEESDTTSYDIDLPNGGYAIVMGNSFHKRTPAGNSTMVTFGEEGGPNPDSMLYVVNNTFVNDRPQGCQFVRIADGSHLSLHNNIFAGTGSMLVATAGSTLDSGSNSRSDSSFYHFADPLNYDYRLPGGFPGANEVDNVMAGSVALEMTQYYKHPLDSVNAFFPTRGAFPYFVIMDAPRTSVTERAGNPYPNPFLRVTRISVQGLESAPSSLRVMLTDEAGVTREMEAGDVRQEGSTIALTRNGIRAGVYRYRVFVSGRVVASGGFTVE